MTSLRTAFSFLTILPVGPRALPQQLASTRAFFPLVGLALGGALAVLDLGLRQVFPLPVVGAILAVAMATATRGLHFEGFIDCCDGLYGGFTPERRLEILKDPRRGSFAIIGGASLLLLQWVSFTTLPAPWRPWALVLFPCLSRWGMVVGMDAFPYARPKGLGAAYAQGRNPWQVVAGLALALAASIALMGGAGLVLLAAATGGAWLLGRWMTSLLGGLTGDCYGAVNEVTSILVLLLVIVFDKMGSPLFGALLPTGV